MSPILGLALVAPVTYAAPAEAARLEVLTVETSGLDQATLRRELALRLPRIRIGDTSGSSRRAHATVKADPEFSGRFNLEVVVPDGRAYGRSVRVDPGAAERLLAIDIANLVAAIEDGTVEPDRRGVALPGIVPSAPVSPAPAPRPRSPPDARPPPARVELAPSIATGPVFGVGAPSGAGPVTAYAGTVALDARFRSGALVSFGFRAGGWRISGLSVARFRIALGGGYGVRAGRFAMPVRILASIEPWILSRDGTPFDVLDAAGQRTSLRPNFGLALRTAPSVRFELRRDRAVRLGLGLEVAVSAVFDDGPKVPRIARVDPGEAGPRLRVGGVELWFGPEAAFVFGI